MATLKVETEILTDEHAAASYGLPVLVVDGIAYGPGDYLPRNIEAANLAVGIGIRGGAKAEGWWTPEHERIYTAWHTAADKILRHRYWGD